MKLLEKIPLILAGKYTGGYTPDRKKIEQFSIPKQLAYWMINRGDETIDIDRIKEEVLEALRKNIRQALKF